MFGENVLKARAGHRLATRIEKKLRTGAWIPYGEPGTQRQSSLLPQWQNTLAPSFAEHVDAGLGVQCKFILPQPNELRNPEPRSEGETDHRPIAKAGRRAWIWHIQQRLHLITREIVDDRLVGLLYRDRTDPACLVEAARQAILEETEESLDCDQSCVARLR